MRRKAGVVLPIERELLGAGVGLMSRGIDQFHGFLIAHEMRDRSGARDLIAYGNLYRVLERMEKAGWLESAWEDPELSATEKRPRRRLYHLTALGLAAANQPEPVGVARPELVGN
jgi:PadR family transcriptional regulator, regulatory protein PadR